MTMEGTTHHNCLEDLIDDRGQDSLVVIDAQRHEDVLKLGPTILPEHVTFERYATVRAGW